jgi:glycosyltransferase involved in cell wall biosynthesis
MSESTAWDERRRWWKERVKQRLVGLCSAALVGGRPHADYLASLGMPRERIFPGYDAVDNGHFTTGADAARHEAAAVRRRLGLPTHYFLASARFIPKKNLVRLVQGYARYRRAAGAEPWDLVLLGDGQLRPELEKLRADLGLEDHAFLPGFKQYGELPAYYGLAGAFVHASTTEQWGLVVNEAMAGGLPVLVSRRCGCAPDLVREGENGFTFNPHDIEAIAQLLGRVGGGGCDREAMGRASRRIIARWDPQTFGSNLAKAVEASRGARRPRLRLADGVLLRALIHR